MAWLADPQTWLGLVLFCGLEVIFGFDNLIFLAMLTEQAPEQWRSTLERIGLTVALVIRLGLLAVGVWAMTLVEPVFALMGHPIGWHDIFLAGCGVFLLAKGTHEIHGVLEGEGDEPEVAPLTQGPSATAPLKTLGRVVAQMLLLDLVFSLDSVAISTGLLDHFGAMAVAAVLAMGLMLVAGGTLSTVLDRHRGIKLLALAFLLVIGTVLLLQGTGLAVSRLYLYFVIVFAGLIELLNMLFDRPPADRR
jgi:predicted tellurium resistance membrane protein TerC